MAMGTTIGFYCPDSATWGYKWGTNQVTYTRFPDGTPAAVMPEFYQLQAGVWAPVSPSAVPAASQLASVTFDSGSPPSTPGTYTVPSDPGWTNPGPAAGPFQARIEDGNVVTHYWYRFADQPAIMKAGLTHAERDQLQAAVVKIHRAWTNGGTYLAPPTMGTLADVDPALLVTPPAGLEVGYVPIATSEAWGGWITFTWNQATSGKWSVASNWSSASAPEAGGHSYYRLTFSSSGNCVATNDLSNGYGYGGYAANQLNFSGAVTLTGNPITLTADVGSYPQINQNSGNGVMINTPLNLDVSATLGGTGHGLVVISNVISGPWHSLTLNNSGGAAWRICGLAPNTYSGGTIIKSGTLIWGATTNGTSPDCSYALGSGPVTLNSGATLQFEKASPTNALTLNGGTFYAANNAGVTWMGPVTVNSNTTVRTDYGMGISGNISGARGLTKTGTDALTLSGVNTYTGANLVQAGTLSCSTSASLGAGALSISNGAVANLNYSGTRTIFALTLGGTNMLAGVYGSPSSSATYKDAHFSGTGTVTVPVPISLANLPATGIATNQATLNASLGLTLAYGGTNATVLACWGTVNGGTNPAAWANSAYVGQWTNIVSTNIAYTATGLAMNTSTTYYFAFLATNAVSTVWATNVLSFTAPTKLAFTSVPVYPPAGYPFRVTVQAQDANGKPQNVTCATTVQLSKSSGSGTLSGTVSGTIVNGSSSVVISGMVYSAADTMALTATAISGMSLTAAASPPITFMPPDLTWDANGTGTGVSDGGGTWFNTSNTWWNGTTNMNWADNYNARIGSGGAGGTITLDTVTANLVTFTNFSGTYTLTSGSLMVVSNLTVANSAGSVVLGYVIGGTGGVTMNSPGSLRLYGLSPNTYSGGTIINRGTLIWGTMVNGISPECNYALGTGPVTLNSGATLQFERANPTNALTLNGGTFYSGNGWGVIWMGPVNVNSNTTVRTDYRMEFSGNISGAGGFTKTSGNTATLSGANTYTGANVVQAGTLSCSQAASLGSGVLSISNGAVVNLNYSGTATIAAMRLGSTNMAPGVYGSTSSPATYQDSHFSGTGTVTVAALFTIANSPATTITTTMTALNATLNCATTNAAVYAYWNTINGGTNAALWTNSAYLGSWAKVASTNLSYTATGLVPNTTYYFTFRGTNAGGNLWATNVLGFTTAALPPAPVLWLGFNGGWANSGTSTNNHVVSHLGSAVLSNVVANSGCGSGSVYLPGTAASYVAVTNVSDLNFNTGSAFTLCAWINTSTPGVIAAKSTPGGSSANHTPAFYVDTSGVLRYDVFYVNTVTSSATVTSGQWTHVAVTCDGTTYRLYINGAPDGAKAFGGANDPGTWDFTVGLTRNGTFPQPNGAANGPFAGDIDEVAVWNSALSPNQLAYVYQNGVSLPIPAALAATAATGITTTSATLHGTLACTGTNAAVLAFWNTVNGGTNAALWTNSAYVGSWTNVASTNLSLQVSGLIPQTEDENAKMGPFCCSPR